jgi:hypothetical protein
VSSFKNLYVITKSFSQFHYPFPQNTGITSPQNDFFQCSNANFAIKRTNKNQVLVPLGVEHKINQSKSILSDFNYRFSIFEDSKIAKKPILFRNQYFH